MMKAHLFGLIALATIMAGGQVSAQTQNEDPLNNSQKVNINRELPRTALLPHNNRDSAMSGNYLRSPYIQWLGGEWKVKSFSTFTQIDTALTLPAANLSSWSTTTIPETKGNGAWAAVYRHEFKLPFAWIDREIFVHVGAVTRAYYVYVNGKKVGYHEDAKTPAEFDVTKYVVDGKNHLAIIAYSAPISATLENQITTKGTAIEQDVYIFAQPKVRIRDNFIDTRFDPNRTNGLLNLGVIVKSHLLNPKQVTVYYDLYAPDGTFIIGDKRDARFDMRLEDTVRFFTNLPNIESWSHENPKLYTLSLRLQHEGRYTEYTTTKIGFRTVGFDNNGVKINGYPIEINAVNYTAPQSAEAIEEDFKAFKNRGVNLVRIADFPQDQTLYNLADQYGIYICDQANIDSRLSGHSLEIGGTPANDPNWEAAHNDRALNMYHQSQNHPSVVMFSLGGEAGRGYSMQEAYLTMKSVEKDRPVIYEDAGAEWNTDIVVGTPTGRNSSDKRYTIRFSSAGSGRASSGSSGVTGPGSGGSASASASGALTANIASGVAASKNITIEAGEKGKFTIRNGMKMTNLASFRVVYSIMQGKKEIATKELVVNAVPETKVDITVPIEDLKPGKYNITLRVVHSSTTPHAVKGETVTQTTIQITIPRPPKAAK